jgi:hypothetical protein
MNFQIPRWAHVAIVLVLAGIGAVTAMAAKGDLQLAGPVLSVLAIVASLLHSVDPAAAGAKVLS